MKISVSLKHVNNGIIWRSIKIWANFIKNTRSENKLFARHKAIKILQIMRSCKFLITYFFKKYHPSDFWYHFICIIWNLYILNEQNQPWKKNEDVKEPFVFEVITITLRNWKKNFLDPKFLCVNTKFKVSSLGLIC